MNHQLNFEQLFALIQQKISQPNSNSYTYTLANQDIAKLVQKIGEEGVEVTIAGLLAKLQPSQINTKNLINESCDLIYHLLILLACNNINLDQIYQELFQRNQSKHV